MSFRGGNNREGNNSPSDEPAEMMSISTDMANVLQAPLGIFFFLPKAWYKRHNFKKIHLNPNPSNSYPEFLDLSIS